MRQRLLLLLPTILLCVSFASSQNSNTSTAEPLLTCFRCLGNTTKCSQTCQGRYCYKIEGTIGGQSRTKRGCLNKTDELSRVDECTPRTQKVGALDLVENVCICSSHRCNSSSSNMTWAASILSFFSAILAWIWHD